MLFYVIVAELVTLILLQIGQQNVDSCLLYDMNVVRFRRTILVCTIIHSQHIVALCCVLLWQNHVPCLAHSATLSSPVPN
jgi:hypothetical protein